MSGWLSYQPPSAESMLPSFQKSMYAVNHAFSTVESYSRAVVLTNTESVNMFTLPSKKKYSSGFR